MEKFSICLWYEKCYDCYEVNTMKISSMNNIYEHYQTDQKKAQLAAKQASANMDIVSISKDSIKRSRGGLDLNAINAFESHNPPFTSDKDYRNFMREQYPHLTEGNLDKLISVTEKHAQEYSSWVTLADFYTGGDLTFGTMETFIIENGDRELSGHDIAAGTEKAEREAYKLMGVKSFFDDLDKMNGSTLKEKIKSLMEIYRKALQDSGLLDMQRGKKDVTVFAENELSGTDRMANDVNMAKLKGFENAMNFAETL
jgi:hypothetical protein